VSWIPHRCGPVRWGPRNVRIMAMPHHTGLVRSVKIMLIMMEKHDAK